MKDGEERVGRTRTPSSTPTPVHALLERIVEHLPVAVAMLRGHDLRHVIANPAYEAIAGDGVPVVGRRYRDVFARAAEAGVEESLCAVMRTGRPWRFRELPLDPTRASTTSWWEGECLPFASTGGAIDAVLVATWEVTDRKRAREGAHEQREQLVAELEATRRLQQISLELVREDDANALYRHIVDAALTITNADFACMQRYEPARGQGGELQLVAHRGLSDEAARVWDVVQEWSRSISGLALRSAQRVIVPDTRTDTHGDSREAATYQRAGILAAQSTPLVSRSGEIVGMLSTYWRAPHDPPESDLRLLDVLARQAADLLEHAAAEAELRRSDARFEELVKQVKDYAIFSTDTEGRATTWNKGVEQVLGFTAEEFVGRDVVPHIFTPEDLAAGVPQRELEEAARYGAASNDRWLRRKSGERFFALGITTAIEDETGRVVGFSKVMRDHTDLKRAEDSLREGDRRKDEFLAMLAHELRNPLAPIRSAAQVLKSIGLADARQQWARDVIERQTQHLTRLVDDLLDVSRITRGQLTLRREPVALAAIVQRAVETSRPFVEAGRHTLTVEVVDEPVLLDGDLTRLVQVIGNLLNNAAKFTPQGGHIRVDAAREGAEAVIRVRDSGVGIPPDLLPYVFDPFKQGDLNLDRSQSGLGIGLTLVRSLVELHGGSVEARSDGSGAGSEFIVRLPARVLDEERASTDSRAADAAVRPMRILVVEDNVDSAQMLAMLLRLSGHDVRIAHNGPQALDMTPAFRPQIVLCDIGLPGMNGYEVARRLREQPAMKGVPLVALTGYGQENDRHQTESAGFDRHLVKPVEPAALQTVLDQLVPSARSTPGRPV